MSLHKEDWHSKKKKDGKKLDRWQLYTHHVQGATYCRHQQGSSRLNKEYKHTHGSYRAKLRSIDLSRGQILPEKTGYIFKGNEIQLTYFDKMNLDWSDDIDRNTWELYHREYKKIREDWELVPINQVVGQLSIMIDENAIVIGDFGCGEAIIASHFSAKPNVIVHSYDLHQSNDCVVVADISNLKAVGVSDNYFDVIVCCLASNSQFQKKINEIKRTIKPKGLVIIWQPVSSSAELTEVIQSSELKIKNITHFDRFVKYELKK